MISSTPDYQINELNDAELETVNGGNFFLGVLAGFESKSDCLGNV